MSPTEVAGCARGRSTGCLCGALQASEAAYAQAGFPLGDWSNGTACSHYFFLFFTRLTAKTLSRGTEVPNLSLSATYADVRAPEQQGSF